MQGQSATFAAGLYFSVQPAQSGLEISVVPAQSTLEISILPAQSGLEISILPAGNTGSNACPHSFTVGPHGSRYCPCTHSYSCSKSFIHHVHDVHDVL